MNRFTRTIAALTIMLGVATSVAFVGAAPAQADDATMVARVKAELTRRIDLRLAALRRYGVAVENARHLTDAHEATLEGIIRKDTDGLTELKAKVATETTLAALRGDAASMVNDYRVFLLVGPQVRLSIAGDTEAAMIPKLQKVHDELAALVERAKQAGKDTAAAEQDLADMQGALRKASADIDGQVDKALAIQPGPDADAILAKLGEVRRALAAGRLDLRTAVAEAKHVRDFLKSL